jgi:flap endonuclease-1
MYNLVNLFKRHGIVACFVFDGKPPEEKSAVIQARREERYKAYDELVKCEERLAQEGLDPEERSMLMAKITALRQKSTRITQDDVTSVKELLTAMGVVWVEACGEADGLCAKMAIKHFVNACVSEDMDMFVYGCPVVWRHLSLLQETVVVYDTKKICEALKLTVDQLKEICVASGTDYSCKDDKKMNLANTMKMFRRYSRQKTHQPFYEWLDEHTKYVDNMCMLYANLGLFDTRYVYLNQKAVGKKGNMKYKQVDNALLHEVMAREDFYFPKT